MSGDTRFSVDDDLSDYVKHHVLASQGNGLAKRVLDSVEGKKPKHRDYFVAIDKMNGPESEVRRVLEKYRELR